MNREEGLKRIKEQYDKLSDTEKQSAKVLFHNTVEFDYDEVEKDGEIIPTITDKKTNESYNLFEYVKDKSNIINVSYYWHDVRRG
jgi:bisphosphoglycerate-independent phosphoglycerate mutase (AlkP superfamily)